MAHDVSDHRLLVTGVGILFWVTNGLVGAPELVPVEAQAWLQANASMLANPLVDITLILIIAALILALWSRRRKRLPAPTRDPK